MNIAMHTNSIIDLPVYDQLRLMKMFGISGVMLFWYKDKFENSVHTFPEHARKTGLEIENVHVPYHMIDGLWKDSHEREDVLRWYMQHISDCSDHEIEKIVMHPVGWQSSIKVSLAALDSYKRLADHAEKKNVKILLENVASSKYLDFIFNGVDSPSLKFCYDNGHEMLMPEEERLLLKYSNRVEGLHLTDNNCVEDLHMLPFDGKENWKRIREELHKINYAGRLAFEVGWQYRNQNKKYSHEDYVIQLVKRAERIINS
ncbi:TIM barrel protein [Acidaminobacter sp. JC074]|uniref:sugar phosphate isomerase/epimerase family protein n=1 Tax=Acidaminobacter sp. JC074 TaxID=2530199 RepID=UPI001F0F2E44|nr:sugar phosphate isomerase/epimerase family protein [Acidaminobacter sp. JC074]MCH4886265.1 TIM barrel protein [Acidaminobacter sp. JC074]